jgi:hypothetical protein
MSQSIYSSNVELAVRAGRIFEDFINDEFIAFSSHEREHAAYKDLCQWLEDVALPSKWCANNIFGFSNLADMVWFRLLSMYGTQDLGNALLQEHIESMHKREYKTLDIWLPERDDNVKQEVIEFFQNDGFFEEPDYNELFAAHDKQEE